MNLTIINKNEPEMSPETVYGRLLESVHISGYSMDRACAELEWLLEDDRWMSIGPKYDDIDTFLGTITLAEFKISVERRKKLVKLLSERRATQRAAAKMLGVSVGTVNNDCSELNETENEDEENQAVSERRCSELNEPEIADEEPPRPIDVIASKWTGDQESYTPAIYIEAARKVMGSIDIDPASNDIAQETVKAVYYYTKEDNGLTKQWHGNIFLNPPYSHPDIKNFVDKLLSELRPGQQAILLTNNNTDTNFFHDAANAAAAVCFTKGRINFLKPDGSLSSPTNGQVFFYFGENRALFHRTFSKFGLVMKRA